MTRVPMGDRTWFRNTVGSLGAALLITFAIGHPSALAGTAPMTGSTVNYTASAWNSGFPVASGHHVSGTIKDTASNALCAGAKLTTVIALASDPHIYKWNCSGNGTTTNYTWEPQHTSPGGITPSAYTGAKFQPVNGNNGSPSEWGSSKTCNAGSNC